MNKQRVAAIAAGFIASLLLVVAALSNGLGSDGAAAATRPARPTPVVQTADPTVATPMKARALSMPQVVMPASSSSSSGSGSGSWTAGVQSSGSDNKTEPDMAGGLGGAAGGDD